MTSAVPSRSSPWSMMTGACCDRSNTSSSRRITPFACFLRPRSSGQRLCTEIDCLVSDIDMPGMEGYALLRVRASRAPELPVILITGYPDALQHLAGLGDGTHDVSQNRSTGRSSSWPSAKRSASCAYDQGLLRARTSRRAVSFVSLDSGVPSTLPRDWCQPLITAEDISQKASMLRTRRLSPTNSISCSPTCRSARAEATRLRNRVGLVTAFTSSPAHTAERAWRDP